MCRAVAKRSCPLHPVVCGGGMYGAPCTVQPGRLLQAEGVASGLKPAAPERGRAATASRLCAKHNSRQDAQKEILIMARIIFIALALKWFFCIIIVQPKTTGAVMSQNSFSVFYFATADGSLFTEPHQFLVIEAKKRLLSQLSDIDGDAKKLYTMKESFFRNS